MDLLPFVGQGLDQKAFSAAGDVLRDARAQQEGLLRSVYPYFNVTTSSVLRRLSLVVLPYWQWESRSRGLPFDLYLGFVGHFFYAVALAARGMLGAAGDGAKSALSIGRGVLVGLVAAGIEILGVALLARAVRLHIATLDVLALSCYKALPSAVLVLLSALGPFWFWPGCVLLGAGAAVHLARLGIGCIKREQAETLVPTRIVNLQNWFVLVWAVCQPVVMCLLAYWW